MCPVYENKDGFLSDELGRAFTDGKGKKFIVDSNNKEKEKPPVKQEETKSDKGSNEPAK